VRDGGGIKPDIEAKPDTLTNIAMYLFRGSLDSTEVVHYYVVDYINSHESIAKPEEYKLSDEEFADFKQRVIKSGFKYDRETSKEYKKLVEFAKFEGYYDDAKAEFDALEKKLEHNLEKELDKNRDIICQLLEQEIVTAYYHQNGRIANMLRTDTQVRKAKELLLDKKRYQEIIQPK
jgi:carboxyl-terminal processing protease